MDTVQRTITERVEEIVAIENRLDSEHAGELRQIRTTFNEFMQTQMQEAKEKTAKVLYRSGINLLSFYCVIAGNSGRDIAFKLCL